MSENLENNIEDAPVAETPAVEETSAVETPVVEEAPAPEMNRAIHGSNMESTVEPVEEPKVEEVKAEMPKPENVVSSTSIKQDVPSFTTKPDNSNQVAVYALRSLTLPSGTIPAGYSYVSKAKFDQISHHKAVRKASAEEIKTYLK